MDATTGDTSGVQRPLMHVLFSHLNKKNTALVRLNKKYI